MSSKRARKEDDAAPASVLDRVAAIEAALAKADAELTGSMLEHNTIIGKLDTQTTQRFEKLDAAISQLKAELSIAFSAKRILLTGSLAKIEAAHADLSKRFFTSNTASQMLCDEVKQDFRERDERIAKLDAANEALRTDLDHLRNDYRASVYRHAQDFDRITELEKQMRSVLEAKHEQQTQA